MNTYTADHISFDGTPIGYIGVVANVVHLHQQRDRHAAGIRSATPDFVGREAELDQLRRMLAGGGSAAICGVTALGGMGKTQLALKAAEQLQQHFDYQLLIEISGRADDEPALLSLLAAAIHSLGPEIQLPDGLPARRQLYSALLAGKRMLVVVDNAWSAAHVAALQPPPGCALLATSRNRLSGLRLIELGVLSPAEATALLLAICPRIAGHAAALAELCGFLPLALSISASFLSVQKNRAVERYLDQLRAERLRHLALPDRRPDDPQASIDASLHLSYDTLAPEEQEALCALSIAAAPLTQAAALALIGGNEADAEAALDTLLRRSLLDYTASTARYHLHDLVRAFGTQRLGHTRALWLRYARHFTEVAKRADDLYQGRETMMDGLRLFDDERQHIDATWTWLRDQPPARDIDTLLLTFANTNAFIGDMRYDQRSERIPQLEALRTAASRLGRKDAEGSALGNLGTTYMALGNMRAAISYHEQALVISRELGDRRGEGISLGNIGAAYMELGDIHTAIAYHKQRLIIAREVGDRRGEGSVLGNLGLTYFALGNVHQAISYYEQALTVLREIGDRRGEGNALGNIGSAYAALGNARTAITYHEQALAISRGLGDQRAEAQDLGNLGLAYADLGDIHQAITNYKQVLIISRRIGDRRSEGNALGNLGIAYEKQGQLEQAISSYEQSIIVKRETGDQAGQARTAWNLGTLKVQQGALEEGVRLMEIFVTFARQIGHTNAEQYAAMAEQVRRRLAGGTPAPQQRPQSGNKLGGKGEKGGKTVHE